VAESLPPPAYASLLNVTLGNLYGVRTDSCLPVPVAKHAFTSTLHVVSFNTANQLLCNLVLAKLLGRCHLHSCDDDHVNHLPRLHADVSPPALHDSERTRLVVNKSLHSQPQEHDFPTQHCTQLMWYDTLCDWRLTPAKRSQSARLRAVPMR
jgi:hypothetical protein